MSTTTVQSRVPAVTLPGAEHRPHTSAAADSWSNDGQNALRSSQRYIANALSVRHCANVLSESLKGVFEQATIWRMPRLLGASGSELVWWTQKLVFCTDDGLCWQSCKGGSRLPVGDVVVVPWRTVSKVS